MCPARMAQGVLFIKNSMLFYEKHTGARLFLHAQPHEITPYPIKKIIFPSRAAYLQIWHGNCYEYGSHRTPASSSAENREI